MCWAATAREECRELVYRELRSSPAKSFYLLEAFALMEDGRAPEIGKLAMRGADRSKDPDAIAAAALRCLAADPVPGPEAVSEIFAHLARDRPIGARRAALELMPKVRTAEMVEKLIGLMDDPALKNRAHLLLVRLAGREAGLEKRHWEEWWETMAGNVPEDDLMPVEDAEVLMAAGVKAAEEDGSIVSFYGVPIEGEHVLFVLDASTSMRGYPARPPEGRVFEPRHPAAGDAPLRAVVFPRQRLLPARDGAGHRGGEREGVQVHRKARGHPWHASHQSDGVRVPPLRREGQGRRHLPAVRRCADQPDPAGASDHRRFERRAIHPDPHHFISARSPTPRRASRRSTSTTPRPRRGRYRTGWEFLREVARRHDGKFSVVEL